MTCVGIIPARGGSKGIPRKNIVDLGGKPLIAWSIEAARAANSMHRVLVSTDDEEIAEVARGFGAEVPFLRPAELARDDSSDWDVFLHAVEWLHSRDGKYPELVVWLRPTAPLRTVEDIEACLVEAKASGAAAVRTLVEATTHPYWCMALDQGRVRPFLDGVDLTKYHRRQDLPPAFNLAGSVEVIRTRDAVANGELYGGEVRGIVVPRRRAIDIDSPFDLEVARALLAMEKGGGEPNEDR
jgi:CMP-N-acetylneuraminic acid synthetase